MDDSWLSGCEPPNLAAGEVHIWRLRLTSPDRPQLLTILAADEQRRAGQFLFDHHREHFVVGRARMRQLLAAYAQCGANELDFAYENLGKPRFRQPELAARFHFNFSNSGDLGLFAITRDQPLGVDLERVRPMQDMLGLAKRYFADSETEKLTRLSSAEQPAAFFRCWTRKEAYLKAIGKGLTFPLRNVEVEFLDDRPCRIYDVNGDRGEADAWTLMHLSPAEEFPAALAIRRRPSPTVRLFAWPADKPV